MMRKYKNVLLITVILIFPWHMMFADDVPADFFDATSDNPDDAPISNYFWMGIIALLGVVYLVKRKYFKKA